MAMLDLTRPIATRNGREAVYLGRVPEGLPHDGHPIVARVLTDGEWSIESFTLDGRFDVNRPGTWDLVNVREPVSATVRRIREVAEAR